MVAKKHSSLNKQLGAHLMGHRPGRPKVIEEVELTPAVQGLSMGNIEYRSPEFFIVSPDNAIFESLKNDDYFFKLKEDIDRDGIINALISLPDGRLIEGHSRLKIAAELGIVRIPVRFVLDELNPQQLKRRIYLGNLNRFEIPVDVRLQLFAELYPDYFTKSAADLDSRHREAKQGDLNLPPMTADDIAQEAGISKRRLQQEKRVYQQALKQISTTNDSSSSNLILDLTSLATARAELKQRRQQEKYQFTVVKQADVEQIIDQAGTVVVTFHASSFSDKRLQGVIQHTIRWLQIHGQ